LNEIPRFIIASIRGSCNHRSARLPGALRALVILFPESRLANDPLTYQDLLRIVEILKASEQFSEFRLKVGDIEVELRRHASQAPTTTTPPGVELVRARPPLPAPPAARAERTPASPAVPAAAPLNPPPAQPATVAPVPERASGASDWPRDAIVVHAPMVGTFYRAPEPGARPFVAVGDHVEPDSIVCIIEVMKLMNSIPAGVEGVVTHILVEDAAPVEPQAPLIVLAPRAG
jgi:acetyl-CoA carboxylase biotin carboxyl carrier protein